MPIITVPKPLRDRLGDEGADALIQLINQASQAERVDIVALVEEKFERRLAEEISKFENRLVERIARVENSLMERIARVESGLMERITMGESGLVERIARVESGLVERIANSEARLLRWAFIFWLTQLGALAGILFSLLKR